MFISFSFKMNHNNLPLSKFSILTIFFQSSFPRPPLRPPIGEPPLPKKAGGLTGQSWYHASLDRKNAEAKIKRYQKASFDGRIPHSNVGIVVGEILCGQIRAYIMVYSPEISVQNL